MYTKDKTGYVLLLALFLLSAVSFLYLNVYSWTIYLAITFAIMFVIQLFLIIRNSGIEPVLKKDAYTLLGLLILVVVSNILWVFVFPWCKYIASISSLIFVYILFTKLRNGSIRNKLNEN
ncbi:MAG: hypothetical protein LBV74_15785 [Tannerella sp.]|jgi:hypothetical protein|nr:hypothetical protein [Tannerella sp.]